MRCITLRLQGSQAYATALGRAGVLTAEEAEAIKDRLSVGQHA